MPSDAGCSADALDTSRDGEEAALPRTRLLTCCSRVKYPTVRLHCQFLPFSTFNHPSTRPLAMPGPLQACQRSSLAGRSCTQHVPQGSQQLRQQSACMWRGQCLRQTGQQRWAVARRRRALGRAAASAPLPFGTGTAPHQSQSAELLAGAGGLLQSGSRQLQSAVSGLPSADELLQSGAQRLQSAVSGLPGAGELLQSGSQQLQSAFGGMQPPVEDTHQPLTKIAQVRRRLGVQGFALSSFPVLNVCRLTGPCLPVSALPPILSPT